MGLELNDKAVEKLKETPRPNGVTYRFADDNDREKLLVAVKMLRQIGYRYSRRIVTLPSCLPSAVTRLQALRWSRSTAECSFPTMKSTV